MTTNSAFRWIAAGAVASASWIAMETAGGLLFLGLGVRLWRYEIVPVFAAITSPVIWGIAFLLIVPLVALFDRFVARRLSPRGARLARLGYLMTAGPVLEVVINEAIFRGSLGRPLYVYLVAPTFDGSGSLLSPLYYATLYPHLAFTDRIFGAPLLEVREEVVESRDE